MPNSNYRMLPSLASLAAFSAVVRHGSFTRAALELRVTQSAVSHQIKTLEGIVGVQLLARDSSGLCPTAEGLLLVKGVREGLDRIQMTVDRVKPKSSLRRLRVVASSSFGNLWLVPRLARFIKAFPDIQPGISFIDEDSKTAMRDDIDVVIGLTPLDGLLPGNSQLLWREKIFPVCSPVLLAGRTALSPEEIPSHVLIEEDHVSYSELSWSHWFARAGLSGAPANMLRVSHFGGAMSAAVGEAGIALGRSKLIDAELARGALVPAVSAEFDVRSTRGFFLEVSEKTAREPAVQAFTSFVIGEIGHSDHHQGGRP